MLTEERFAQILQIVNEEKSVTVQELKERLHTSESTIRRDLTVLDRKTASRESPRRVRPLWRWITRQKACGGCVQDGIRTPEEKNRNREICGKTDRGG